MNTALAAQKTLAFLISDFPDLRWIRGMKGDEIMRLSGLREQETDLVGVFPDGGIFMYPENGVYLPILAIEAKHQGAIGNAIERWYKNKEALSCLNSQLSYLTICTGEGAKRGGIMRKILNHALVSHARENRAKKVRKWGKMYFSGPSFFHVRTSTSEERLACLLSSFLIRKIQIIKRS